jgi:hypothetical protein
LLTKPIDFAVLREEIDTRLEPSGVHHWLILLQKSKIEQL